MLFSDFGFRKLRIEFAMGIGALTLTVWTYLTMPLIGLPQSLQLIAGTSALRTFLTILFACLAIFRIMACVLLYRTIIAHWLFAFICLLIAALLYQTAYSDALLQEYIAEQITMDAGKITRYINIKSSRFKVDIDCSGNAKVVRHQILTPRRDITSLPETNMYSAGGLSVENITVEIRRLLTDGTGAEEIPSSISEYNGPNSGIFMNTIEGGYKLEKGNTYSRIVTIIAKHAYTDPNSDGFIIAVNYPADVLECVLHLAEPCKFNPKTLELSRYKRGGILIDPPTNFPIEYRFENEVRFQVKQPRSGDYYGVFWKYAVGPSPTEP